MACFRKTPSQGQNCWALAVWLTAAVVGAQEAPSTSKPTNRPVSTAERIAYYQQQVERLPNHYPAYARLGRAWLDQARETYDPTALSAARGALRRSLEIQQNFEALHDSAAVANYSHRFEEALRWCGLAAEAFPEHHGVLALRVEALLALDRGVEAREALGGKDAAPVDFHIAASLGQVLAADGQRDQAAAQLVAAAKHALDQQSPRLAQWATISAAGVWLDAGELAKAKPLLEQAASIDATDVLLRIHRAELAEAEQRHVDALGAYEELCRLRADPELRRRACALARAQGRAAVAEEHFAAAEKLCRRAVDAGEVYSLETLAKLYCDAGRVPEAIALAERNLEFKRDAAARETLARARQAAAGK